MDATYPKKLQLNDGRVVEIRPMESSDLDALVDFFGRLPTDSTDFLKDDVKDPAVVTRFVANYNPELVWPVLALKDGRVVGDATLHMQQRGWRRHVGEVRVVVDPEFRRSHLAIGMIHELVDQASLRKLAKLEAQILGSQVGALRAFQQLGFTEEARLKGHALDAAGHTHDLLIMTNTVADLWTKMTDMIEDHEFHRDVY